MKRKLSSRGQNLRESESVADRIADQQRKRIRRETAAAYAKAKAGKIGGSYDWDAFVEKHRPALEEFLRARHGGGLEPLAPQS